MKIIGLLGGMSWQSTIEYYRLINDAVKARLGGFHSAKIVLYSVDFSPLEAMMRADNWTDAAQLLGQAALRVQAGGADCLLLCTNTFHIVAQEIQECLSIPMIHIADATAEKIKTSAMHKVGLLGTNSTMEGDFYKGRVVHQHNLEVYIPSPSDRDIVHQVIFDELVKGKINPDSRREYQRIIETLADQGAEAVILGCTEISLLIKPADSPLPTFDTTELHALAAVDFALADIQRTYG
ncbi:MAG: aspartate/glutamate racemase family protein [Chloroflexi bacterium]|nr:aspartate/glutamate racemase family protein [Chloroflexota bacterium]